MSKVFLTGSGGFIGSHLKRLFKEVVCYDLKDGFDIRNQDQLEKAMKGCDVVVHLAAFTSVKNAWDNPSEMYENNVIGTSNVIEAAIKLGIKRIVFASSSAVYSKTSNPYSASKAMDEILLQVRQDQIQSVALRFFNVYGKGQNPDYGTVIPSFFAGIPKGKIQIYGDGRQVRDFIHVDDVCRIIKLAVETKDLPLFSTIDVGTGRSISINNLAGRIAKLFNKKAVIERLPSRKEVKMSEADTRLLKEYFNYEPLIGLGEGLERVKKEGI